MNLQNLFFISFLLIVFTTDLPGQISPGDLTKAHSKLEGMSNCTKCHLLGEKVINSKCLDCHTEIKNLMESGKGYHSSPEVKGKECFKCHSEHNGRDFRIINFDARTFDHNKTGYSLTGRHAEINCKGCHQPKYISSYGITGKKIEDTFLGLSQNCFTCHEDYHQNTLGNDCGSCHNTSAFKPAVKFNHSLASFALTGAHNNVECIKCHIKEKRNGKDFQVFKGISFNECTPCHEDIHKGKLGKDCKSCHSTSSFKNINRTAFDHNKTDFPLEGKHRSVSCNECHKNGLTVKLKFQNCYDCHADFHKGEFVKDEVPIDCSGCHNLDGFQPSLFTLERHESTSFKLTGAHLAVNCRSCHYKNDEWHFKNIGVQCIDCHKNVHGNEITVKFMPDNNCKSCHSTGNWKEISFDHNKTEFVLNGRHQTIVCSACHYKKEASGETTFKFVSLKNDCEGCHADIHLGQFGNNGFTDCRSCHNFDNWIPSRFSHDRTNFPLTGSHKILSCDKCHKKIEREGITFTKYKIESFKCADCHS